MYSPSPRYRAFTLVELLVVIGIIALLISILLPALSRARAAAIQLNCSANMRSIMQAFAFYSLDNGGYFPPCDVADYSAINPAIIRTFSWPAKRFAGQYIGNTSDVEGYVTSRVFFCPSMEKRYPSNTNYGAYAQDMGIGYNARQDARIAWRFKTVNLPSIPPWTPDYASAPLKIQRFKNSSSVIMLSDVVPDWQFSSGTLAYKWAKMYNDDLTALAGTGAGMGFSYRHNRSCNVAFADGHVEAFRSNQDDSLNFEGQKNQGLHQAILDGAVTYKAAGPLN